MLHEKTMKKILVIAYVFPPIAYGGTFRTQRLCKYLARKGYELTVLTIDIQADLQNDFQLLREIEDKVDIVRTKTIDPWRSYQKIKGRLLATLPGRIVNKIVCLFLSVINQIDHMVFWVPFVVVKGYKLIKKNKISIIYTSSPPHSEQLSGYLLKKLTGVKWIADFRDPIIDNIAVTSWNKLEKKVNHSLERIVMNTADHIVVNTKYVHRQLQQRYPGFDISAVRNSFDVEDFSKENRERFRVFTISHVGSIYAFRKIDAILGAIRKLATENIITPENFLVRFVGLNEQQIIEEVQNSGLQEYVRIENMVSHSEALDIMAKSNLLLLIKGFGKNSASQIPGKLYEYIGTGNKIIYVGPKDAEAADIIRELDVGYIVEDDAEELSKIFQYEYDKASSEAKPTSKEYDLAVLKYSSSFMAEEISHIIEKI